MSNKSSLPKLDYNLPFTAFIRELEEVDNAIGMAYYRKNKPMDKEGKYFPYIRMHSIGNLVSQLLEGASYDIKNRKFLDIGAGTGRILALRKYLTDSPVVGVELNSVYANAGIESYGVEIVIGDAFKVLTKNFLRDISTIYTYMPIADMPLMRKLERQIEKNITRLTRRIEMLPEYFEDNRRQHLPISFIMRVINDDD